MSKLSVKFDIVEGVDSDNKPVMVSTRSGDMTAGEVERLVKLPTFVKATIKNKGFNWKKPLNI